VRPVANGTGIEVLLTGGKALAMRNRARAAVRREHRIVSRSGRTEIFSSELRAPGQLVQVSSIEPDDPLDALAAAAAPAAPRAKESRGPEVPAWTEDPAGGPEKMATLLELAAR
jgi:hypothetical protein